MGQGHKYVNEVDLYSTSQPLTISGADLFQALEATTGNPKRTLAKHLGIQSYGVSMTTLEEVFLKLSDEEDVDERDMEMNAEGIVGKEVPLTRP